MTIAKEHNTFNKQIYTVHNYIQLTHLIEMKSGMRKRAFTFANQSMTARIWSITANGHFSPQQSDLPTMSK